MRGTLTRILAAWAFTLVAFANGASAGDNAVEYGVKGTYLYKFLPFVDWPQASFPAQNTPFTLCILGHDPFGAGLDHAVANFRVNGRAIAVRRIDTPDTTCHVVYIGASTPEVLQSFAGKPVLTVTDAGAPGIISFVIDADHVRFDINEAAADSNGLTISSKLLSLARSVKTRGAQP